MIFICATIIYLITPLYYCNLIKIYQLSYYRIAEVITSLKSKKKSVIAFFLLPIVLGVFCLIYSGITIFCAVALGIIGVFGVIIAKIKRKTKLNLTTRLKTFILLWQGQNFIFVLPLSIFIVPAPFALIISVLTFLLSSVITNEIYAVKNKKYCQRASEKLKRIKPIVIGIVGSYGKTTTKNALKTVLSQKYTVVSTPESYNTTMGVARAITENLSENTQIFIAEMGARYPGDIAEICALFQPDFAVITALGNQHLQTFKSEENLIATKGEILDFLSKNSTVFINADSEKALQLYKRAKCPVITSGRTGEIRYDFTEISTKGTSFTVFAKDKKYNLESTLISPYAPSVLTECMAVALKLGLSDEQIINGIKSVKAVAHRLELLYNGIDTIIDDSYNANECGAQSALKTLGKFSGTKIVITPGIVELGKDQATANYRLGKSCAENCDYAVFLGVNKSFLYRGAIDGGMKSENIKLVKTLNDATAELKKIKGARVILFENDLPENY